MPRDDESERIAGYLPRPPPGRHLRHPAPAVTTPATSATPAPAVTTPATSATPAPAVAAPAPPPPKPGSCRRFAIARPAVPGLGIPVQGRRRRAAVAHEGRRARRRTGPPVPVPIAAYPLLPSLWSVAVHVTARVGVDVVLPGDGSGRWCDAGRSRRPARRCDAGRACRPVRRCDAGRSRGPRRGRTAGWTRSRSPDACRCCPASPAAPPGGGRRRGVP